ncbi:hypothetical protein [Desulfonatronovibrio magnus]|uniref:hypothetical protein n=1 Tax=Desulfonatronovibrio magnus TaxID=698827 RepID=UPI001E534844|nr:hypothetical protein [Desulfonatronovibrio magnus]
MERIFNNAGPTVPRDHYHIDPLHRLDWAEIQLKILRGDLEQTIQTGLEQTVDYADRAGADEAHLIIFNRDRTVSWDEKIFRREETFNNRNIIVWGA